MHDGERFNTFCSSFENNHPDLHFGRFSLQNEETLLKSDHGGMKLYWIFEGSGEVLLRKGVRTREGDGAPLPAMYLPEAISPTLADLLTILVTGYNTFSETARGPIDSILSRRQGLHYIGDYANDLWKLAHIPRPWSPDTRVQQAVELLFSHVLNSGYSIKQEDSFEPIMQGDQLCVTGEEPLVVRGTFTCLTLEHAGRRTRHIPPAMRLRYLRDSSGGCNFDFDPFRRLPLTWYMGHVDEQGDGVNFVNSHVVNIARETSPTHFHPRCGPGGGLPQYEIYLVLQPQIYELNMYGRKASLVVFPDLMDLHRHEEHALRPGSLVCIPPGVGHRGLDVFVNVLTVPGFKPHNEYYIDQEIHDATQGAAPCNENLFGIKNYTRLEDVY